MGGRRRRESSRNRRETVEKTKNRKEDGLECLKLKEPRSRTRKGREELTRGPSTFELRRRLPEKRKERRRKRGTEEEIEGRERMF